MFPKIIKLSILFVLLLAGCNTASATFTISRPSTHNLGLVGYWTMDGGDTDWTTNTVTDKSGNGNTGQMVNMSTSTSPVIGKIGQALFCNSNSQEIDVDNSSSIDLNNTVSVAFWVKFESGAAYTSLINKLNTGVTGYSIIRDNQTNGIYLRIDTSGGINQTSAAISNVLDNTWHHIVWVLDSGSRVGYRDGVETINSAYTHGSGFSAPSNDFRICAGTTQVAVYDDVRIYNRALSASEVKSLYNQGSSKFNVSNVNTLKDGLVGYWTMDGGDTDWTTNTLVDKSGNGGTAYMQNMSTSSSPVIGKIGQAFDFDGTDDYASSTRINNNEVTIAAWAYKDENHFSLPSPIFDQRYYVADENSREGFYLGLGHLYTYNCGAGATSGYLCASFIAITTNGSTRTEKNSVFRLDGISKNGTSTQEWFHLAGTYNSAEGIQRLYVNGVLRDTDAHTAGNTIVPYTITSTACHRANLKIGRNCVNANYFNGKIDDVRLYNRALSGAEIKKLYLMGR